MPQNTASAPRLSAANLQPPKITTMAVHTTEDGLYKLFPSPRNRHRSIFEHRVFVPHPYLLIDLESYGFAGKFSLFAACRLMDMKMGQLVTLETALDEARFKDRFVPD
jgi:hypothetical protein